MFCLLQSPPFVASLLNVGRTLALLERTPRRLPRFVMVLHPTQHFAGPAFTENVLQFPVIKSVPEIEQEASSRILDPRVISWHGIHFRQGTGDANGAFRIETPLKSLACGRAEGLQDPRTEFRR